MPALKPQTVRGKVVRDDYAGGTKSEHSAVMLETPSGTYKLRRTGGPAFVDPVLDDLVGKMIVGAGNLHRDIFLLTTWHPTG